MKIERIKNEANLIFPNRQFEPHQFLFRRSFIRLIVVANISQIKTGKKQKSIVVSNRLLWKMTSQFLEQNNSSCKILIFRCWNSCSLVISAAKIWFWFSWFIRVLRAIDFVQAVCTLIYRSATNGSYNNHHGKWFLFRICELKLIPFTIWKSFLRFSPFLIF